MTSRRAPTVLLALAIAAFLAADLLGGAPLRRHVQRTRTLYRPSSSEAVLQARNESAFGQILGEVRATTSDLLFVKANRYLHAGVGYESRGGPDSLKEGKMTDDEGTATVIRAASRDFRGFLGHLEREVKPYRDAAKSHVHTELDELLPWFRLMTLSNPRFVRGYRVGGITLVKDRKWHEALDFINEGLANNHDNPELFRLYQTLSQLHRRGRYDRRYPWGDQWLDKSLDAALRGYELARRQRPPLGEPGARSPGGLEWSDDIEEDFRLAAHLLSQLCREAAYRDGNRAQLEEALRYAQELAQMAPDDTPIRGFVKKLQSELAAWPPGAPPPPAPGTTGGTKSEE